MVGSTATWRGGLYPSFCISRRHKNLYHRQPPVHPPLQHRQRYSTARHSTPQHSTAQHSTSRRATPRRFASRQSSASLRRDRPTLSPPNRAPSLPLLSRPVHPRRLLALCPLSPFPFPSPAPYVGVEAWWCTERVPLPAPLALPPSPPASLDGWIDGWMDGWG